MIIKRKIINEKWFENKINTLDCFKLVSYRQFPHLDKKCLVKIKDFLTLHINLIQKEDEIFKNFSKNVKYEVKRAKREGVNFSLFEKNNIKEYLNYYNDFAKAKNLSQLSLNELNYYWDYLIITQARDNQNNILSIHSYLVDKTLGRARLFHSISLFRTINDIDKNLLGRANRFLHWQDIIYFKNNNYKIYDMGGVAMDKNNASTVGIDKFKLGFSKNIVKEYNLVSPLLFLLMKLKGI